jgi:hypothetical protein
MELAPIVLFVYNRPWHTRQTLDALIENELADQSILYVFADGPKADASAELLNNIQEAREVVKSYNSFKELIFEGADANIGVADSIIGGITKIVNKHGKVIVLEDDIITGKGFLKYMNEALSLYENEEQVACIHAYNLPIKTTGLQDTFFLKGADCWGWGTWKRGWDLFNPDTEYLLKEITSRGLTYSFNQNGAYNFTNLLQLQLDGKIDAWDIRFHASAFLKERLTLYPAVSIVRNIGLDGSGIHCHPTTFISPYTDFCQVYPIPLKESKLALRYIKQYYIPSLKSRIIKRIKKILHV